MRHSDLRRKGPAASRCRIERYITATPTLVLLEPGARTRRRAEMELEFVPRTFLEIQARADDGLRTPVGRIRKYRQLRGPGALPAHHDKKPALTRPLASMPTATTRTTPRRRNVRAVDIVLTPPRSTSSATAPVYDAPSRRRSGRPPAPRRRRGCPDRRGNEPGPPSRWPATTAR